jgi:hypothetical protein
MALVGLLGGPVTAETSRTALCAGFAVLAAVVMEGRQIGVPLGMALGDTSPDSTIGRVILGAYEQPRYTTARVQQRVIADYRDEVHMLCLTRWTHE